MNCSRIASAIFACLLVTAGVAGPMAQPVQAAEAGACSDMDDFVMFLTLGAVNSEDCSRQAYVDDALEDYDRVDSEQTKVDIYSSMSSTKTQSEAFGATYDNYLTDTETVAWSKMQVAVAEAYQNGSTEEQAKYEAEKAIEGYYSVKQRNLIAQWNGEVTSLEYAVDLKENDSNIGTGYVYISFSNGNSYGITEFGNNSYTLANGTSVDARTFGDSDFQFTMTKESSYGDAPNYNVGKPTTSYDSSLNRDLGGYMARWEALQTKQSSLIAESDTYINATFDDYESGNINASDVISTQTAMFEYGTRSGDTNESLYDTVGALAIAGFDTPSINGTGTMDITYNGQTYTGLPMARTVPGGSWSANTTYNTSNFDGPVFIATTDGQKIDLPAEGASFTVEAMRAQDGSSLSSVNTTTYNYKTTNALELQQVQSELSALRSELEERKPSGGAGGGSGGFGGNTMLIVLAAAVVAAVVLGSQNGGGRNGRGRR